MDPDESIQWPNTRLVPDGIVPVSEVSQDPCLFDDDDGDLEMDV